MRRLVILITVLAPAPVLAGHGGGHGGGGGGGALGHVSSGLGRAGGGGSSGGSSAPTTTPADERDTTTYVEAPVQPQANGGVIVRRRSRPLLPPPPAHFEGYVGASKVVDSDASWSAELGIVDDWFRVDGSYTRYYEAQPGMATLTMNVPELTGGVRLYDGPGSRIYLTLGVAGAKTKNDAVMDSSFVGAVGGARIEMPVNDVATLVGVGELMVFGDKVTATSVRAGVRVGPVQASLRVLDFNVGPPLWGPELGVHF